MASSTRAARILACCQFGLFPTIDWLSCSPSWQRPVVNRLAFVNWFVLLAALLLVWPQYANFTRAQTPQANTMSSVLDGEIKSLPTAVEPSPDVPAEKPAQPETHDAGDEIDELLTKLVLGHLPHDFKQDKDWGTQAERFDGLKVRRKGLQIRTKRKKKMVNHGSWRKFNASLVDPENRFSVSVKNMREAHEGKVAFDLHCQSDLKIDGRIAQWIKGVQLYSLSLDGKARVKLAVTIELETVMDVTKFPPDLIFRPRATAAELNVEDFRIDRISKIGGEVSQQASRWASSAIDEQIEAEETKLVDKINVDLKKNEKKLRLSLHDAVSSKWSKAATEFMPEDVQEAIRSTE